MHYRYFVLTTLKFLKYGLDIFFVGVNSFFQSGNCLIVDSVAFFLLKSQPGQGEFNPIAINRCREPLLQLVVEK